MSKHIPTMNEAHLDSLDNHINSSEAAIIPDISTEYKVYRRRWLMLGLFMLSTCANAIQWLQYSIIADVIMDYYNVSSMWVDMTSLIFMITYIPLFFPCGWILDKYGLRTVIILGTVGTCLGSWLKVFSVNRDMFWLTFLGQTIGGIAQPFLLGTPPSLAAVWFGSDQVSTACSLGVAGNQIGNAFGFLIPPLMVKNNIDRNLVGEDLQVMFYTMAGVNTVLAVLVVIFFQKAPPTPPSAAQDKIETQDGDTYFKFVKRLLMDRNFLLLLVSYGVNMGVFCAISTLLNQVVLSYYPTANEDVGKIGVTLVCAGVAGALLSGIMLDKTHQFKLTSIVFYAASVIGLLIYTFTLSVGHIYVVYISSFIMGFFVTGYLSVGFEYAAEITYPEPEGTVSNVMNVSIQIFGIIFTVMYGYFLDMWGDVSSNVTMCVALGIGTVLTACINAPLRRQEANKIKIDVKE